MSAFYGVPEGDELLSIPRKVVTPVEPTDDPQYLLNTVTPDRDFPSQESSRFSRSVSVQRSSSFMGAAITLVILAMLVPVVNAQTTVLQSGTYYGTSTEPAQVACLPGVVVDPCPVRGQIVWTLVGYYKIKSEGKLYKMVAHGGTWTRRDPLHKFVVGDPVSLRLETVRGQQRLYVIVYQPKYPHGFNKEYRYDIVQVTDGK